MNVAEWGVQEVANWLSTVGLSQFQDKFIREEIDGLSLLNLEDKDLLLLELPMGSRMKLLRERRVLEDQVLQNCSQSQSQSPAVNTPTVRTVNDITLTLLQLDMDCPAEPPAQEDQGRHGRWRRADQAGRLEDGIVAASAILNCSEEVFYPADYTPPLTPDAFVASLPPEEYPEDLVTMMVDNFEREMRRTCLTLKEQKSDLSRDDVFTMYIYSYEMPGSNQKQIYRSANAAMRERQPEKLDFWRPFIFYLDKALQKLQCHEAKVYRGVPAPVDPNVYRLGAHVSWPAFSSSSQSLKVARAFLSNDKKDFIGTLFVLTTKLARHVSSYSQFPEEQEVLFAPNSIFRVIKRSGDTERQLLSLDIIDMEQLSLVEAQSAELELATELGDTTHVITLMSDSLGDAARQAACCRSLAAIADAAARRADIAQSGGVAAILGAMRRHQREVIVQHAGLQAIQALTRDPDDMHGVGKAGGCETVLQAMADHPADAVVQRDGCLVLCSLAAVANNSVKIITAQGLAALLTAIQRHTRDVAVQKAAGSVARRLATGGNLQQLRQAARGPADCLACLEVMKADVNNAGAHLFGCWVIYMLDDRSNGRVRDAVTAAGGVPVVLAGTRQHQADADVQAASCAAIMALCRIDGNRVKVAKDGGIAVVLNAMRRHPANAAVQERGCHALWSLAMNADNQVKIAAAGGVAVVLDAMRQHLAIAGVQENGCGALLNLAVNKDNQVQVAAAGGIAVVVAAMREHPANAVVQENGCAALWNIALNADNQVKVAASGGIAVVLDAMQQHRTSAGVQKEGCGALCNLSFNADNKAILKAAGAMGILQRALKCHGGNASVQKFARDALQRLCG